MWPAPVRCVQLLLLVVVSCAVTKMHLDPGLWPLVEPWLCHTDVLALELLGNLRAGIEPGHTEEPRSDPHLRSTSLPGCNTPLILLLQLCCTTHILYPTVVLLSMWPVLRTTCYLEIVKHFHSFSSLFFSALPASLLFGSFFLLMRERLDSWGVGEPNNDQKTSFRPHAERIVRGKGPRGTVLSNICVIYFAWDKKVGGGG